MESFNLNSTLGLTTLIVALVIALLLLLRFRKRHGDHPMRGEPERNVGEAIDRNEADPR